MTLECIPIHLIEGPPPPVAPDPEPVHQPVAAACKSGLIWIVLTNDVLVPVDAFVSDKALSRVLGAMKGTTRSA